VHGLADTSRVSGSKSNANATSTPV
jgi:hypothetical protein